jgi:Uma2 family endonuclease
MTSIFAHHHGSDDQLAPHKHRLSIDDYHKIAKTGIFHEDMRIELIEGELVDMAPIGHLHVAIVNQLAKQLSRSVTDDIIVSIQNPLVLGKHNEPEPDIAVLRARQDNYRSALPSASDTLLLVEVADSSVRYDREVKIPLYARFEISEVWLLDLAQKRLEIYLQPQPNDSEYLHIQRHRRGAVCPTLLHNINIDLSRLF